MSPADLDSVLRKVRSTAKKTATNFFAPAPLWPAWIRRGLRIEHATDHFAVLVKPEEKCDRLFFMADRDQVNAMLSALKPGAKPLVTDLIGAPQTMAPLVADFAATGFARYLRLIRLACAGTLKVKQASGAERAKPGDVNGILGLLREHFDIYTDQLPSAEEVGEAIEAGGVLVVRGEGGLDGFVWFEKTGVTGSVRYWAVALAARGRGIGSRLMTGYLEQTRECARHLLWVRENNEAALNAYRHYGYAPDGLEDQIMVLYGNSDRNTEKSSPRV